MMFALLQKKLGKEEVLVVSNLRNTSISYAVPPTLKNSSWKDAMKGGKMVLRGSIDLPPYTYFILKGK